MAQDFAPPSSVLSGPALHEAKRALRVRMIASREAIDTETRQQASLAIASTLRDLASFRAARCVLLTLPFRSEWDTRPFMESALSAGKDVALPRVNHTTRMLELHLVDDATRGIEAGYQGVPEPSPLLPRIDIERVDWVLVPGVAFDRQGRRLGYGGGFYDRLLSAMPTSTLRVVGAFNMQVVPEVPAAPHDVTIQQIITETRTIHCPATQ